MGIFELFSKRLRKQENAEIDDVYQYDDIPNEFRVQLCHILKDTIGTHDGAWEAIHDTMCRELGVFTLCEDGYGQLEKCMRYILKSETHNLLDIIEVSFCIATNLHDKLYSSYEYEKFSIKSSTEEAIKELNYRLREHCIGYEYIEGEIIRVDRKFVHKDIIKPAIQLLYEEGFEGAGNEFLKAHKHYRDKNYKESIAESLKSFESTMKTICDEMGYSYNENKDTASKLISILIANDYFPSYLTSHYNSLRTTLESGLPTLRNKTSGHGQGSKEVNIPDYFASYAINLSAVNIVFLVDIYKAKTYDNFR